MDKIFEQTRAAALELCEKSGVKSGDVVVIGCSTSEVLGKRMGTSGCLDTARSIVDALYSVFEKKGIYIAAQCCEHLNRAIIIEEEKANQLGLEPVCVVPHPHAGGSFATTVYAAMKSPVAVEEIKANAGMDIGGTLIGMHLKRVAVPLKLDNNEVGFARLTAARTRPKYIGGERAKYE